MSSESSTKKQRTATHTAAESSSTANNHHVFAAAEEDTTAHTVHLPPDIWAIALHYLYFHEVLKAVGTCRSMRREVPPLLETIMIRDGSHLQSLSALDRFENVKEALIYSLVREDHNNVDEGQNPRLILDDVTLQHALPFLCRIPKLKWCFLGGYCKCEEEDHMTWYGDTPRHDLDFEFESDNGTSAMNSSNNRFASFVEKVCRAYASGDLTASLSGLTPSHRPRNGVQRPPRGHCFYKSMTRMSGHRDDVPCGMCDLICMTFPSATVIRLSEDCLPCISRDNRLRLVRARDPKIVKTTLTNKLFDTIEECGASFVLLPPDFERQASVPAYSRKQIEQMEWLVANGADTKYPRIRVMLVEWYYSGNPDDPDPVGWRSSDQTKRMMSKHSVGVLKSLGVDVEEADFEIIDTSDERTDWGAAMRARREMIASSHAPSSVSRRNSTEFRDS